MAAKFSFGQIQLDVSPGTGKSARRHEPGMPLVIAVLGDFSGRASRGLVEPIGQRRIRRVDCDNFEPTMARLGAKLRLDVADNPAETLELQLETLDDFHPDRLLQKLVPLNALFTARQRLLQPAAAAEAVRDLQALLASQRLGQVKTAPAASGEESDADTLARLLGETAPPTQAARLQAGSAVDRWLRNIVAPSVVPGASPQQAALLSAVDLQLSRQLRWLLHHPAFQAMEAAWRALDMLVRSFGAEESIRICVADISQQEIAADLGAQENLEASGLNRLLQAQAQEQPLGILLGLYSFGSTVADIELVGRLAKLAAAAGAPFVAAASPGLAGSDSFASHPEPHDWNQAPGAEVTAAWRSLRELPEAAYATLCLPRFLLRQPYGQQSEPIEAFPFEEMPPESPHENYLWGNPGVLCGHMLAEAFRAEGWQMQPTGFGEIGDLPLHKFKQEQETLVKPCAEAWLNQRAADGLSDKGLVPVLSIKGRNAVRVGPLRSLRVPAAPLAGRWCA